MSHNYINVIDDIKFQITEIDKEISTFMPLIKKCKLNTPDLIEITALGSILHSFYTGIEKIFVIIAKRIDKNISQGYNWHKDLINRMIKSNSLRKEVISQEVFTILIEYLNFRHFFRNSYDYRLDWEKIKPLVVSIKYAWKKIKSEMILFIDSLN